MLIKKAKKGKRRKTDDGICRDVQAGDGKNVSATLTIWATVERGMCRRWSRFRLWKGKVQQEIRVNIKTGVKKAFPRLEKTFKRL